MKKAIVSVINDLSTDQRVDRTCRTLMEEGYEVLLVGREKSNSIPLPEKPYQQHRLKHLPDKGIWFYILFNLNLLWFLIFQKKPALLWANDLDTLGPNHLISKWKKVPLIYDSHEYFTEVPELADRKNKKRIWESLEKWIFPKLPFFITVNDSIREIYEEKYQVKGHTIRNLPSIKRWDPKKGPSRTELGLPEDRFILILQGSGINMDRGGEEAVQAAMESEGILLLVIGSGDRIDHLKHMAQQPEAKDKVRVMDRLPYQELMDHTRSSDLGLTLDKPNNLNYLNSLPNKLFDYLQAGIPVLASDLPEVGKVLREYDAGYFTDPSSPERIASAIEGIKKDKEEYKRKKTNAQQAGRELTWEKESKKLRELLQQIQ